LAASMTSSAWHRQDAADGVLDVFRRVFLDTNIYIDWLNRRDRDDIVMGPGFVRFLSAVVMMELRAGARAGRATKALNDFVRAYRTTGRLASPPPAAFDDAGSVLQRLARQGFETRRAALVHDVLIALTCRSLGATLYTTNGADFEAIRAIRDFRLEI